MKNLDLIGMLLLATLVLSQAVVGSEKRVLSLESALMEVENTNLSLLAAREGLEQAVEGVRRARAGLLPTVTAVAGQSRNQSVTVGLGLEQFGISRQSDPFSRFNAGVTVDLPLVDLASIAAYRESRYVNEISEYEYQAVLEDIKLAVAETYVGVLRARRALELGHEALARAEELRDITQNRVDAGAANRIDLMRAKLEVSSAKQVVVSRETTVFESEHLLKLLLDMDLGTALELLPVKSAGLPPATFQDYKAILLKREDYLARLTEEDRARLLVKAAGWQRLPSLNAYGDYGYVSEEAFDGEEEEDWAVGIALSVPLFEGGKNKADKAMARSNLAAVEVRLREVEQQVRNEVDVSSRRLQEAESRLGLAEETFALARATFDYALDRFQNGVGDNRELIEAQLGLASAETNRTEAQLLLELGRLRYASATGELEIAL
ncbi:TolC family protein [Pelagicoccus sp. SDUM812005]|uniref:TolC family protein n=1 Tax=Pelagicoccus sp. SDUM812005 TaxID=3041257 RepID=UPI00280D453B|nr:TolC family protein [Pelagicoccus sp. SDUM812005]MDQ8181564.1 TolC family protein [Pelagicoccus sp. SDUM812005]